MQTIETNKYLIPDEIAKIWRVTPRHVRMLLNRGQLRGFKFGDCWRVRQSDYDAFVARSEYRQPVHRAA